MTNFGTVTFKTLWQPNEGFIHSSAIFQYLQWLQNQKKLQFKDYSSLWKWSVQNIEDFWMSIWNYFNVQYSGAINQVLTTYQMPGAQWFEGTQLNYAEHVFRNASSKRPALLYESETKPLTEMSWEELTQKVKALRTYLIQCGIKKGDRVAGYLTNSPEATISFLAVASLGAIWSCCSPDFGALSVIDRFKQIEPKLFIATTAYSYNGKNYNRQQEIQEIVTHLPTLKNVVLITENQTTHHSFSVSAINWENVITIQANELAFERVAFNEPLWILYSSGTTGLPKAITQSHGGILLEHFKYLHFNNNVQEGSRFFWYSTTGWMMWNVVQASLLVGATAILYDGSASYPSMERLWALMENSKANYMGVSAGFILSCTKNGIEPYKNFSLKHLTAIGSTGSVLTEDGFEWVYEKVKKNIWLVSTSGGTDICSGFVGGCPLLPVYAGEIQCRALGCSLYAFDEKENAVENKVGEMVITKPMPSMPIYFWGDKNYERYRASYFEMYPGYWRHGDWIRISTLGTVQILGRSDATLNRMGVRIGTSEIYQAVEKLPEIADSLIINVELPDGNSYMPLFVVLASQQQQLNDSLKEKIKITLRHDCSPRHVPDEIIAVPEIPYTISGKKMETPVKEIFKGVPLEKIVNKGAMRNPNSIDFFVHFAKNNKQLQQLQKY